ncbi:hypothetical protein BHE74_00012251 [Ensete ventricosum]|nr:hypothetical protein BHE74_00012251 [Ensete ventricosum]RZR77370.1 hypothetical protein BHM03_00002413 [Ensete ventricosum]
MTLYITREASKVLPSHDPSVLLVFSFFATFLKPFLPLQLWRKVYVETSVELQLLAEKWKLLLAGLVFQVLIRFFFLVYPWAVCSRSSLSTSTWTNSSRSWVYDPSGELGKERGYISESLFTFVFLSFVLWTFYPFVYHSKRFYTVLLWRRVLAFLVVSFSSIISFLLGHSVACQVLRIITFYSTQLPGPNYHCREVLSA